MIACTYHQSVVTNMNLQIGPGKLGFQVFQFVEDIIGILYFYFRFQFSRVISMPP